MKKLSIILAIILLISSFCVIYTPVFAETDLTLEEKADVLSQLSIMKGGIVGTLKRCDTAILLVRILGKEEFVLENRDELKMTPFSDVPSSASYAPYIGYCTQEGIFAAVQGGRFKPLDIITEKQFLKIILVVLGYVYNEDFQWPEVYATAYGAGLVTDEEYLNKTLDNEKYTRADMVNVLYNALTLKNKQTGKKLIQLMVDEGAVSAALAASLGLLESTTSELEIIDVNTIDENTVSLKLSEEADDSENADVFVSERDDETNILDAYIKTISGDEIVIETSEQTADVEYTLKISGITDSAGNVSEPLMVDFTGYRRPVIKSDFFRISKVEAVGNNMLNLYFTQPVNSNTENALCYEISRDGDTFVKGSPQTLTVKSMGASSNAVTISLKSSQFIKNASYTLKVDGGLIGLYGVKLNDGKGENIKFKGVDAQVEDEAFELSSLTVVDNKTVQLEFSREVNPLLAQQIYSYYITDSDGNAVTISSATVGGTGSKKGRLVSIGIDGIFEKGEDYKLKVIVVNDVSRQYFITDSEWRKFVGKSTVAAELSVRSTKVIDKGTLEVTFNKPLNGASAVNVNNYTIHSTTSSFSGHPVKVFFDQDNAPEKVRLYMPADELIARSKTYELIVDDSIKDSLGNSPDEYLKATFKSSSDGEIKPYMTDVLSISSDAVKVEFSKEIASDFSNICLNFYLEYKVDGITVTKMPAGVNYFKNNILVLRFDSLDPETNYTLKITSLKDFSGQHIRTQSDGKYSESVEEGK